MKIWKWEFKTSAQKRFDALERRLALLEEKTQDFGDEKPWGEMFASVWMNAFLRNPEQNHTLSVRSVVRQLADKMGFQIVTTGARTELVKKRKK